jgi:hypothetical protein
MCVSCLRYRTDWCDRHFLHGKGLRKAKEVRQQLFDIMQQQKLTITSCGQEWDIVRKVGVYVYGTSGNPALAVLTPLAESGDDVPMPRLAEANEEVTRKRLQWAAVSCTRHVACNCHQSKGV